MTDQPPESIEALETPEVPETAAAQLVRQAQAWGRAFLLEAPWEPLTERLSLILIAPQAPPLIDSDPPAASLWFLIDRSSANGFPERLRRPLMAGGVVIERHPATASTPAIELAIRTVEAVEQQLAGTDRRALELRWSLLHAAPVSDRLRRLETLAVLARMLPADGLERAVRGLWLDANSAAHAMWPLSSDPAHALVACGELVGSLLRLACLVDEGSHPPAEFLRAAASSTRIGQRLDAWLDDVSAGFTGDEAAGRRAINASAQVLEEVRNVLHDRFADKEWLQHPTEYQLRARR